MPFGITSLEKQSADVEVKSKWSVRLTPSFPAFSQQTCLHHCITLTVWKDVHMSVVQMWHTAWYTILSFVILKSMF